MYKFILNFMLSIAISISLFGTNEDENINTKKKSTQYDSMEVFNISGDTEYNKKNCKEWLFSKKNLKKCGFCGGRTVSLCPDPRSFNLRKIPCCLENKKQDEENTFCPKMCRAASYGWGILACCNCSCNTFCLFTSSKCCTDCTTALCKKPFCYYWSVPNGIACAPCVVCITCHGIRYVAEKCDVDDYVEGFDRGSQCLPGDFLTCRLCK